MKNVAGLALATSALLLLSCDSEVTSEAQGLTPDATADAGADDTTAPPPDTGPAVEPSGVKAVVNPAGASLFDAPFPSDLRRTEGGIDLRGFPNPNDVALVSKYVQQAERLHGFGLTPTISIRFEAAINASSITEPVKSGEPGSNVILVDVDKESPGFGRRYPLRAEWHAQATQYIPANTLMLQPLFGTPLAESTTYALLVLTSVRDAAGAPIAQRLAIRDGLAGTGPLAYLKEPITFWLKHGGEEVAVEDIAVATVFTTGTPTEELRQIARWIQTDLPTPEITDIAPSQDTEILTTGFDLYEGHYATPNLQAGDKPYQETGGDIRFGDDGAPIVQHQETLRFALAVPQGDMPAGGWPIVLYGHGTGGDWKSFARGGPRTTAIELTEAGFAVMGIDQPLHGERAAKSSDDPEFVSFNFLNPDAVRSNFRQSAVDVLVQARVARALSVEVEGRTIAANSEHVYFFGHSHGALAGALMAPFSQDMRALLLSAAGGGISHTLLHRKDPVDFEALLKIALQASNEPLSITHPMVSLIQMLVDITDPLAYAPHILNPGEGLPPINVLMTEGPLDTATPATTTDNLASAARIPILNPDHASVTHGIIGLKPASKPVDGNYKNKAGQATSVLAHFTGHGHFAVFQSSEAVKMYRRYFTSAVETGRPIID